MQLPTRIIRLRKDQGLTQQAMADKIGIHVSQLKRYEAGTSQPTLEVFKRIVLALHITADELLFEPEERNVKDEQLKLQFEAIASMPEDNQLFIKEVIDGMILKYEAKRWTAQNKNTGN